MEQPDPAQPAAPPPAGRLVAITLDEASIGRSTRDVDHDRRTAIFDLLETNLFEPEGHVGGDYALKLAILDNKLVMEITYPDGAPLVTHFLALGPFRRVVKDYFLICDSYYQAVRTSSPSQIEAIDMARRGIHNEGCEQLIERLKGRIHIDFDTARRLFTLITVLRWKG